MPHPPFQLRSAIMLAAAAMLASCATTKERVVTVQGFEPHPFFDGNQPMTWIEFTFATASEGSGPTGKTITVVDVANYSDDSFGGDDGKTLRLPVSETTCPILRTDGARYRITARFDKFIHLDIPGAHWILMSCTPVVQ